MGKYIHVPQGRSARLTSSSDILDIAGLYTSGYSTCCIITAVSKKEKRMCLMHIDILTPVESIKEEIEILGSDVEILILYKEPYKNIFFLPLKDKLEAALKDAKIKTKAVDMQHDGVKLPFEAINKDSIESVIEVLPNPEKDFEKLMRHPQEQQFLAAQKIEQIIGGLDRYHTKLIRKKYINIFDGLTWEFIPPWELSIHQNHETTRDEIDSFNRDDDYFSICAELKVIVSKIENLIPFSDDSNLVTMDVAFWLEGYLNDFNSDILLLRDTKYLVNPSKESVIYGMNPQKTKEDKDFSTKLFTLLSEEKCSVSELTDSISEYKNTPHQSEFKEGLLIRFSFFHKDYLQRKMYEEMDSKNKTLLKTARALSSKAVDRFRNHEYEAAFNLFFKSLKAAWQGCLKSSKEMVTLYYNLGRSQQMCGRYNEAKSYLTYALMLRTSYPKQNGTTENDIAKTKKLIAECEERLSQSEEVVEQRGASPGPVLGGGR